MSSSFLCTKCQPPKKFPDELTFWRHYNKDHPIYKNLFQEIIVEAGKCDECLNCQTKKRYKFTFLKVLCSDYCLPRYTEKTLVGNDNIVEPDPDYLDVYISINKHNSGFAFTAFINIDNNEYRHKDLKYNDGIISVNGKQYPDQERVIIDELERIDNCGFVEKEKTFYVTEPQFAEFHEFLANTHSTGMTDEVQNLIKDLPHYSLNPNYRLRKAIESNLTQVQFKLRPYQREGIHWLQLLSKNNINGILADDMGLGKTAQAILASQQQYLQTRSKLNTLILCPVSVIPHWRNEIKKLIPASNTWRYSADKKTRMRWIETLKKPSNIFVISSYQTLVNDIEKFSNIEFETIILDEATKIKNPDAKRTRLLKTLKANRKIALTGTPIENRPQELWSVLDFLNSGILGSRSRFKQEFDDPIRLYESKQKQIELSRLVRPFILRRTKENVAKDLPEKIPIWHEVELTDIQFRLYQVEQRRGLERYKSYKERGIRVTAALYGSLFDRLKFICNHPCLLGSQIMPSPNQSQKFDITTDIINDIMVAGERAVFFSQYLRTLDLFEVHLNNNNVKTDRIDGLTKNRQAIIDRYNNEKIDVLLCSVKAAGHGINLIGGNHVIHYDRWWNPATEDQATDRLHRIGQKKNVLVYRFITSGTIEVKIHNMLEKKRRIAEGIMGPIEDASFSHDEILEILTPKIR